MQTEQVTEPTVKPKKTKYYVRFLNRLAHFEGDIELVDVFKSAVSHGKLVPAQGNLLFEHLDTKKHPRLAARVATPHGREIALMHLKRTLCSSFIKDLYEEFSEYLRALITGAARMGRVSPERLASNLSTSMTPKEILSYGNWDSLVEKIGRDLFRKMEEDAKRKGVIALLSALEARLDLGVHEDIRKAALPYLELRHKLVHANGVADEIFCNTFPSMNATVGGRIDLDDGLIVRARAAVGALIKSYDECAVRNLIIPAEDLQR